MDPESEPRAFEEIALPAESEGVWACTESPRDSPDRFVAMSWRRIVVEPVAFDDGVAADVHTDDAVHHLWIASPQGALTPRDDLTPWAMTLLPYVMRKQMPLHLAGAVDEVLLSNLSAVQGILSGWYPRRMHQVEVTAERTIATVPAAGRGAFFSGGVDSFFTLSQAPSPLDAIVLVGGFDIPLEKPERTDRAAVAARKAAEEFGTTAVVISTNLRSIAEAGRSSEPVTSWGYEQHGASLAAVSYTLRATLGEELIASAYAGQDLHPWGSHPSLDPLWSSSAQRIVHDTTAVSRVEKVAAIMRYTSAREGLRVCWMDADTYNCGVCEKCVRTRINLRATGHDGSCQTLPVLSMDEVRSLRLVDEGSRIFAEENLRYLRGSTRGDEELEIALKKAIDRGARAGRWIPRVDRIPGARRAYRFAKKFFGR